MTDQGRQLVDAASRIRRALERTAGALTTADLDGLLRSEGDLEEAVRAIAVPHTLPPGDREAVRAELQAVGRALVRCRRLGRVLVEVVGVTLEARGEAPAYGRRAAAPASYGRRLNATG